MTHDKWTTVAGGLMRYQLSYDDAGYPDGAEIDYYARGVGWTSLGAAQSSWTPAEQNEVRAAVREIEDQVDR